MNLLLGDGNTLIVNEYKEGEENQQWVTRDDRVKNKNDENRVFDIAGQNEDAGARICAWDFHGKNNQLWDFEYQ